MLQALSQLGKIEDKYESTPNIKHIIGMVFDSGKYIESKLYDFNASEYSKYLYEGHDASGKPGLFLTGNIPLQDVKNLSDANTHSEFIRKKILWFSHGKLVKNPRLFQTLSDQRQWELKSIFKELEDKHEQISRDVIYILTHNLPEQILLTTMIGQQFVGQIQDYVDFFNKGILNKKGIEEQLVCNACNKLNLVAPYTERSLPFFFSDKIHFFDNGNITRSFPICDECYQSLQNGIKFVNNRMNYNISSTSRLIQTKGQKKKQKSTATNIVLKMNLHFSSFSSPYSLHILLVNLGYSHTSPQRIRLASGISFYLTNKICFCPVFFLLSNLPPLVYGVELRPWVK